MVMTPRPSSPLSLDSLKRVVLRHASTVRTDLHDPSNHDNDGDGDDHVGVLVVVQGHD